MPKLTSFAMEMLYYSLKLEVLDQMGPEDVIELVKVNAGFRSMLVRTPWIVFGRHVDQICPGDYFIYIRRRPDDEHLRLDVARHFPLIKLIHSCDVLNVSFEKRLLGQNAAILNQLNSVKRLELMVCTNEVLQEFLENFHSVIGEYACINVKIDWLNENQMISELFKNFIANQINDCQMVHFGCRSVAAFNFYYSAFAATSIKSLVPNVSLGGVEEIEKIVQSVVEKGIPSKNLGATMYLAIFGSHEVDCRMIDFLSRFPGMERLDGENQQRATRLANEICGEDEYTGKSDAFRRNIKSKKDCVYLYQGKCSYRIPSFFAFYIHPESQKIEF